MSSVKSVFDDTLPDIRFDAAMARRVKRFLISFINKNEAHATFFGGVLTGVERVSFTPSDANEWFTEILDADASELEMQVHSLPTINTNFYVSSNVFNISCVWAMHRFMTSTLMSDVEKQEAASDVAMILNCSYLTSLLFNYVKYPLSQDVATAAYASLSMKFSLKKFGSWYATLRNRSDDIVGKHSIHHKVLMEFTRDEAIVNTLNDTQGRIRDMLKNIIAVSFKTSREKGRIKTTSTSLELDGESIIRDKTKGVGAYLRYIETVIPDETSFIKEEISDVVCQMMPTMPPLVFTDTLKWLSANYAKTKDKDIEEFVRLTVLHSFDYLSNNRNLLKQSTELSTFIARLRGVYMSSRSTDSELIHMRLLGESIVAKAYKTRNSSVIASARTGVMLFIVLRAYSMQHYSS